MDRLNSSKELKNLIDEIPGGIGIFDVFTDGKIELIYLNNEYYKLIGAKRNERKQFQGFSVINAIPEDLRNELKSKLNEAISVDGFFTFIVYNQGTDENRRWLQMHGKIVERTGEKCVFYVTYTDVTDYERTTQALKQAHAEIEIASNKVGILYWIHDVKNHLSIITRGKGYGYQTVSKNVPESFIGTGEIFPEDEKAYLALYTKMEHGVETCEDQIRILNHRTNKYQYLHIAFSKIADGRYVGSSIDISDQKQMEEKDRELQHIQAEAIKAYQRQISAVVRLNPEAMSTYQVNITKDTLTNGFCEYPNL